jgi:hypothetical protein
VAVGSGQRWWCASDHGVLLCAPTHPPPVVRENSEGSRLALGRVVHAPIRQDPWCAFHSSPSDELRKRVHVRNRAHASRARWEAFKRCDACRRGRRCCSGRRPFLSVAPELSKDSHRWSQPRGSRPYRLFRGPRSTRWCET